MLTPWVPLLLKARGPVEEAGTRLSLQEARGLEDIAERAAPQDFRVRMDMQAINPDCLDRLETLFGNFPGPCLVVFELRSADGSVALLQAEQGVRPNPELVEAVRQICGDRAVEMAAV